MNLAASPNHVLDIRALRHQVSRALAHLYDPELLAELPLIQLLGLERRPDRSRALRSALIEAIQRLKPADGDALESPQRQMYQVLMQRFVRCVAPETLADQLGMSARNLRRQQARAIAMLADVLLQGLAAAEAHDTDAEADSTLPNDSDTSAIDRELEWLRTTTGEPIHLPDILTEILPILEAEATGRGSAIINRVPMVLPPVAAHPGGLRQAIISLAHHAIEQAGQGQVVLEVAVAANRLTLMVHSELCGTITSPTGVSGSLVIAERILRIFGGNLVERRRADGSLCLEASLALAGAVVILAIDDNADALQLYERYLAGTRYRLIRCQNPAAALDLTLSLRPAAVLMDIMMPHLDGWELLGRLRHRPEIGDIPIIICTIVAERGLAFSAGAAAFVQKPVTRLALLATLGGLGL
ncbi:MAG: ATP-binding response regulator [Anaerolineae bacterium]